MHIFIIYTFVSICMSTSLSMYINKLRMKIPSKGNKGKETGFPEYFRPCTTFQGILLLYPYIHICMHEYIYYMYYIYILYKSLYKYMNKYKDKKHIYIIYIYRRMIQL